MISNLAAFVDEFYQMGIREVVISPGSRSTPLAMLFCERGFQCSLNIDERSAGFFALGIAKERKRPAVLVCTSGSAVTHYFPAITEAKYSRVPLIIVSADRPAELQSAGAPQTIDQIEIFGKYVKLFQLLDLYGKGGNSCRYSRAVADRLYAASIRKPYGVVHVNVPLAEPLMPDFSALDFAVERRGEPYRVWDDEGQGGRRDEDSVHKALASHIKGKKGVLVCGPDAYADYGRRVLEFAERMKVPVLADPLSNLRRYSSEYIIDSYDAFLKEDAVRAELEAEFVIHIGQVPVSKRLQHYLSSLRDPTYIQIDEAGEYRNTALTTTLLIRASVATALEQLETENIEAAYAGKWMSRQKACREKLDQIRDEPAMCEGKLVAIMQDVFPEGGTLVSANSMSVRHIDYFWRCREKDVRVVCNRGTNGIDGTLSTALGVASVKKNTVLVTGDLAFLHDISGLTVSKTHGFDLTIVVFNNNGGGIFAYLPQYGEKYFDELFRTPHGISFEGVSQLYGVTYFRVEEYEPFREVFLQCLQMDGVKLIEVSLDMESSLRLHGKYVDP